MAQELYKLDDEALVMYFLRHARYLRRNPRPSRYAIRVGARALFGSCMFELRQRFVAAVRD